MDGKHHSDDMLKLDYNLTEANLTNGTDLMLTKQLTTSYPRSVANQTNLSETNHQVILTVTMTLTNPQTKSAEFLSQKCLGTIEKKKKGEMETRNVKNHVESSNSSLTITRSSGSAFKPHELHHSVSQLQNGITSSKVKPLTSTQCSHHCTIFLLLKRTLDAWDQLKYPLDDLNQPKRSKQAASGPALGTPPSKRLNLLSLTENMNSESKTNTLRVISPLKSHLPTKKLSSMTSPFAMKSVVARMQYSLTPTILPDFTQQLSCLMELNPTTSNLVQSNSQLNHPRQKSATTSIQSMGAETQLKTVDSSMPVNAASAWATEKNIATSRKDLAHELRLKYLRYNIWEDGNQFSPSSADWTETASPLPPIPSSELANPVATKTIRENPHLFDIVTPIFVDRFEKLLESHPNQPIVKSVCCGLQEGFLPWANTHFGEYPNTLDLSLPEPENPDQAQFLHNQCS